MRAQPPLPPATSDDGDDDLDLTFAFRTSNFGDGKTETGQFEYLTIGLDLDNKCTGNGEGPSCAPPSWAPGIQPDGADGRDNNIGKVFYNAEFGTRILSNRLTMDNESGAQTVVLRIRHYNGKRNDIQVELDTYSASLGTSMDDPNRPLPQWDGNDRWRIGAGWLEPTMASDGSSTYSVDAPRFRDLNAYVTGGVLVAKIATTQIGGAFGQASLPLHQTIITARIESVNGRWELQDGVLAGRWLMSDLLQAVGFFGSTTTTQSPCDSVLFVDEARLRFCPYADIRVAEDDGSLPCDAISMAYAFSAYSAKLGDVLPMPEPPVCPSTDPGTFECR